MQQETSDKHQKEYSPGYKNLDVWKKADALVIQIYELTRKFPKEELFGLVSQMRRCAVSVPANIVEGYGRNTKKDELHFCYISRGSLNELEYYIGLALHLEYIEEEEYSKVTKLRNEVGKLLNGYMKSLGRK